MRIALLISGYLRGFIENIDCIKNNIIQTNDCDIYIHITENNLDIDPANKYFNKNLTIDYVKDILNPKIILISKNLDFSKNAKINNIYNQNYKLYWLNEERKKISSIENIKYDIVIKIRPDLNIKDKLNYKFSNNLYIPIDSKIDKSKLANINDKYICDILAYGSPNIMDKYFDYYLQLNGLIEKYGVINETLLYYYLNDNNIKYILFEINYFVILSICNTIAITGDSGSGKTTLSNSLMKLFNNSFLLECDRYHRWERGNHKWKDITHLNPNANYITKMENDVFDLKIGNSIYQVDYDHCTGKFTDKKMVESSENIIVCGLHCLYLPDNIINLKIYMDTDKNLKIPWKIKRDVNVRGYTIENILTQIHSRETDFLEYIYPQKEKADIIVNFYTNKDFNLHNFNIDEELDIFLKVGIKNSFNITKIINIIKIHKSEIDNKFIYLYFYPSQFEDYINIIKTIIIELCK